MSNEDRLMVLERELGRIKQRNRLLLGAILMAIGGIIVMKLFVTAPAKAWAREPQEWNVVRANEFRLETTKGELRGKLALDLLDDYPHLFLYGEDGKTIRLDLAVDGDGPSIGLADDTGEARILLSLEGNRPYVTILSQKKGALFLGEADQYPTMAVLDENQKIRAELSATRNGSRLALNNPSGQHRANVEVVEDVASLSLSDAKDKIQARLSSDPDGPYLRLGGGKGQSEFIVGAIATVIPGGRIIEPPNFALLLRGPDDKIVWSAIK